MLSIFLSSEVSNFGDWIEEHFDHVLSGKSEYEEISGNICGVEISPTTTKIYNNLAEDGMGNWCEIDTVELNVLIDEWREKEKKLEAATSPNETPSQAHKILSRLRMLFRLPK